MDLVNLFNMSVLAALGAAPAPSASLGDDPSIADALGGISALRAVVLFFFSAAIITSVMFLVINIAKLGASGDNEKARSEAVKAILVSGACIAVFGSLGFFVAFAMRGLFNVGF